MTLSLKILCGLYAALLTMLGAQWWFTPDAMATQWLVEPQGPVGANNLIADMGGLFFGSAIMIVLGLWKTQSSWLLATALLMAIAAAGRLFSYATVAYVPETLVPMIFEILSCTLLIFTHMRIASETNTSS